jgi:hypothetical protein
VQVSRHLITPDAYPSALGSQHRRRSTTNPKETEVLPAVSIALPVFGPILIGRIAGKPGSLGRDATGAAWHSATPAWCRESALPTGASAFILAKLYGREVASTSGTILVSAVISFATPSLLLACFAESPASPPTLKPAGSRS